LRPFWTALAQEELRVRFRRTSLGPFWATLSFAVFLGVKTLIFGQMAIDMDVARFAVFLALGFWAWNYISGVVAGGATSLITAEPWLQGMRLPASLFAMETTARELQLFAASGVAVIAVLILARVAPDPVAALSLVPAIVLYAVTGFFTCLLLGVAALRHRDLVQVVQTLMRVLFFLTPILWTKGLIDRLGEAGRVLQLNPFTYYLDILRGPIVTGEIPWASWVICLACTSVIAIAGFIVFAHSRRRLAYWY
jgi:ABC-type polysaccharide/polyol phosphate export permease